MGGLELLERVFSSNDVGDIDRALMLEMRLLEKNLVGPGEKDVDDARN